MENELYRDFNTKLRPSVAVWAAFGLVVIPLCVYFDPFQGWRWVPFNVIYEQMMVSVYVAVGIMSLVAFQSPIHHVSFLWFVALSSFTHGFTMLFHAATTPMHRGHLVGDVWIIAGGLSLAIPLFLFGPTKAVALPLPKPFAQYGSLGTDGKLRVSDEE